MSITPAWCQSPATVSGDGETLHCLGRILSQARQAASADPLCALVRNQSLANPARNQGTLWVFCLEAKCKHIVCKRRASSLSSSQGSSDTVKQPDFVKDLIYSTLIRTASHWLYNQGEKERCKEVSFFFLSFFSSGHWWLRMEWERERRRVRGGGGRKREWKWLWRKFPAEMTAPERKESHRRAIITQRGAVWKGEERRGDAQRYCGE